MDAKTQKISEAARLLDELADTQAQVDAITLRFKELRESVVPDDVRERLAEVEAEADTALAPLREKVSQLEKEAKDIVVICGETVQGKFIQAVYNKGRTKWDTSSLEGIAVIYPEILKLKSRGHPYVTLRSVK